MICDDVCGDVWCFVRLSEFQKAPNYETTWFWLVSPNAFLSMKGCWLNGDLLTDRLNSLSPRGKARSHKQEETAQTTDNPGKTIKSKKKQESSKVWKVLMFDETFGSLEPTWHPFYQKIPTRCGGNHGAVYGRIYHRETSIIHQPLHFVVS